jgi:vacuolar-type H+-ATPase subunit C/Vma6
LANKDYEELLALPDLEAMARWLETSQYAREWQLAKTRRQGLEAVEEALESNFASVAAKMLSMAEGRTKRLMEVVMRRWDLQNLLAVVRGIHHGWSQAEIGRWLWPVGRFDAPRLAELSRQPGIKQLADTLATWKDDFADPMTAGALQYQKDHDLPTLELGLLRHYYRKALQDLRGLGHSRALLRSLVRQEIDRHNARAASRLLSKPGLKPGEAESLFIEGGRQFDRKTYASLFDPRLRKRVLAGLRRTPYGALLASGDSLPESEGQIEREVSRQLDRLYRGDPLAADLAVGFLWRKFHEVANLRLLARSKVFGPPPEKLRPELLIFA